MKKICFFIFITIVSWPLLSQEKRDFLTSAYSKTVVKEALLKDHAWVPYPAYGDRKAWESLPQLLRANYIKAGEQYLNYGWPAIKATDYLAFDRTGDRQAMEIPHGQRLNALQSLVMAELMEGKGRFMDDIVNGVFSFCEQTTWAYSACFYMYNRGKDSWNAEMGETNLPDIDDPIVDLSVGDVANNLSWVWYFFHAEFDKISPVISRRLKSEITDKVLTPFYERNDYWWINGWGRGAVNNWTPWCNYNMLTAILLVEDDPVKKIEGVYKTMTSVDLFFNSYPDDGGCDEGPNYWGVAGGRAFDYLNLLDVASNGKMTIYNHPLVKEIGRYVYRAHIADGTYFINFADAPAKSGARSGVVYRYGQKIDDAAMKAFGAFLLAKQDYGEKPEINRMGAMLENLFGLGDWQLTPTEESLISEYYFPDLQVFIARDKGGTSDGFFMAAKGGHNSESHNHNDVGSCIVFYNGQPVLVDAGVGTYTKDTFSGNRYNIWTMQSNYHNLPLINGFAQNQGRQYAAKNSKYAATKSSVSFSTDITEAYPESAQVEKWVRSYTLDRGKRITVSDQFQLREVSSGTELHLMTPLQCSILPQGIVEMKGSNFVLHLKYNTNKLTARIETKEMDDPRLQNVWGNQLFMLIFEVEKKKSDQLSIEIVNVNNK